MKRRDAKLQSDAQRLRQRHPPLASLNGRGEGEREGGGEGIGGGEGERGEGGRGEGRRERGGERGRGSVMPERLKSGFGHHRIKSCGPSNGRHKIAKDRPDFFAMVRSLPGAIDNGRDTLCKPNVV